MDIIDLIVSISYFVYVFLSVLDLFFIIIKYDI